MRILVALFCLLFGFVPGAYADNPVPGQDNPIQVAKLICTEYVENYHRQQRQDRWAEYTMTRSNEAARSFDQYEQIIDSFQTRREAYLGDLTGLMGRRYGILDNRFNRDVRAGVLTRNIAQDGFREAIRDRGTYQGNFTSSQFNDIRLDRKP